MNWFPFKKKEVVKVDPYEGKKWYPVFMKKTYRDYNNFTSGSISYDTWEQIKTSKEYCILENCRKVYECLVNGNIRFVSETDLSFPQKDPE